MFDPNNYNELTVNESPIPGLFVVKLPVHGDNRGWFKENYQKEKMEALGLPSFTIVQNNISFNDKAGATRGLHAEPWNKFISTANGRVFGAWCDLRQGDSFGRVFTHEINPALTWLMRTGHQTPNTPLSIYLTQHSVLTGRSAKSRRLFLKKTPLIHYLQT